MANSNAVPRLILIYAILITLFTTLMVGFSLVDPNNFFASNILGHFAIWSS